MSRRLPVYLLIDTSGSMRGEAIEAVNNGLSTMIAALRQDPHALDSVHLSIITFDREVEVVNALEPLESFVAPTLKTPQSGPTHLGEALETLLAQVSRDIRRPSAETKGDWAPLLFVMTDGKPSDTAAFEAVAPRAKAFGFGNVIGCAAGPKAEQKPLETFCDRVALLDTMDSAGFAQFFRWVSEAIAEGSKSQGVGARTASLPPPPDEIRVVI